LIEKAAERRPSILLIGYGNPGRLDDGLGPALAEALASVQLPGLAVDSDYQLNLEDAAAAAEYEIVVFADASVSGAEPFTFTEVQPEQGLSFSSHELSPPQLLALTRDTFQREPKAYLLGIRGYDFNEFGERLSQRAQRNLKAALDFVKSFVEGLDPGPSGS
jgi:hydrogenase maturation protease